jgi:hypothetical protein
VGSIGEVVAAEALGLTLYPMSRAGHDAYDANDDVQIKMTVVSPEKPRSFTTGLVRLHGHAPPRPAKTVNAS